MKNLRRPLTTLLLLASVAPLIGACTSATDLISKDAEWFSRPGRVFAPRNVSLDTGPLSPGGPLAPNDLVNADGVCAGAAAGGESGGGFALGSSECDVVRSAGSPNNVSIGGDGGNRDVTLVYQQGPRPGIYRFSGGRLTSIERAPAPAAPERPAKRAPAKRAG